MALTSREALRGKLELFIKMKKLAERQEELAAEDDMEPFLELTSKRGRLQQEISGSEKQDREKEAGKESGSRDPNARATADELSMVIQSIQEIDRRIERLIQEKKDGFLSDIKKMRYGQKAIKGYGNKRSRPPKFVDRKS